jgi:glycosyltransferase involved in cell wall biosynthesis
MLISVVVPVYKSFDAIFPLSEKIIENLKTLTEDFEIIYVDDFCPQNSWLRILEICKLDTRIKGVKLIRNYGQHAAISAGLQQCSGDWIVIMDCDLQDDPIYLKNLYQKALTSVSKIVFARRSKRQDNFFKKNTSYLFFRILSYLTNIDFDESVANFGIFHKDIITTYNQLNERNKVFPIMVKSLGFNVDYIEVQHNPRSFGTSSYTIKKRFKLALEIILSYSNKPLLLILKLGFIVSFLSVLFAILTIIRYFNGSITVSGYTSLLFSIWFLSGLIIFIVGFIGLYIGKIFDSIKSRPIYFIDEQVNL